MVKAMVKSIIYSHGESIHLWSDYPLVMSTVCYWSHGPVEIVSFPMKHGGSFPFVFAMFPRPFVNRVSPSWMSWLPTDPGQTSRRVDGWAETAPCSVPCRAEARRLRCGWAVGISIDRRTGASRAAGTCARASCSTYGIFMGFLHGKFVYNQDIYGIFMGYFRGKLPSLVT